MLISAVYTDFSKLSIAGARIALAGDYLSYPRYATTNPFGYYRFVNVPIYFRYQAAVFRQKPSLSAARCFHLSRRPSKFRLYE
ncbi:MAG TPA: carboxypeptidase-like regulatory domain-containing protein [Pyrinomonadaceae bacterium]|jgi:hypothetical protein